ncbi:aldehyde dehydrogenase family protein [Pseudalkalibacillus sp. Hm43]|uniref:aldehyde dehydrogenase family protein n=1 Tax=Pseudalkalibacillus sp. Hm43 TaxID=3450742 RepID=UPI003F437C87
MIIVKLRRFGHIKGLLVIDNIDKIFQIAGDAQKTWSALSVQDRLVHIKALRKRITSELDEWVRLVYEETGKSETDTLASELYVTLDAMKYYEKRAGKMLKKRKVKTPLTFWGEKSYVCYEPMGVVAVFSPWNFPIQLSLLPVISALIAGNTVVLKPSEEVPAINDKIASTFQAAGFPEGVVQVVQGEADVGEAIVKTGPDKIFFTGGLKTGKIVNRMAAEAMIPCDLELSGKDPMIVCEDAELDRAARAAVWGSFFHSGQVCVSIERVYVHKDVYDLFLEKVISLTEELSTKDYGRLTTEGGWQEVKRQVDEAVQQGAKLALGGTSEESGYPHYPPTILTNVTHEMDILHTEVFGPVMTVMPFENDEEAIELSNDSEFGLNASVFTQNLDRGQQILERLETGNGYVNGVVRNISNMNLPFGGVKRSGRGRYHAEHGLHTFCETKSIMVNKGKKKNDIAWFPYKERNAQFLRKFIKKLYG